MDDYYHDRSSTWTWVYYLLHGSVGDLMSKQFRLGKIEIQCGRTDHWGFGIDYCHYERAFTIDFIHWFIAIGKEWTWHSKSGT